MLSISFEINGRKARPGQAASELGRAMLTSIEQRFKDKLRGLCNPETGQPPRVVLKGRSLDNLSIEVAGPEGLIEEAKRQLS